MAKHSPSTLRNLAESNGCSLDIELAGHDWQIILDAPPGKIFRGSGCHCDASVYGNGWNAQDLRESGGWARVAKSIEAIIADGFDECDDPDCDVCHE